MKDRHTGRPRGFGFITYANPSVVDTVIAETHVINGKQVEIKRTIPKGSAESNDFRTKKIFVGGIPISVTEDELKNFFAKYGKVVEHEIIRDHVSKRSRGFGFVVFDNEQVVDKLLADGNMIDMEGAQALFVEPFERSSYFTNLLNDGNFDEFNTESVDHIGQSPQAESTTKKTRGGNFTVEEDEMIITAWLNVSLDAVQGNDQKSKTYWQRVWEYFNNYKSQADCSRTTISLMNRWSAIQLATNKFCGCFSQIERLNESGLTEKDKIRDAKKLYKELYKSIFQFEHCWNELRYQPKWMKDSQRKKQKTKGTVTLCSSTPTLESVNLGDGSGSYGGLVRSPGRKVDKERVRKSKNKLFGGYDTSSYFVKLLEDMKEEKKLMNEKKVEMLERCSLQEQEQERLNQEKERLEQEKKRLDHEKARLDHEKARMQMEQLRDEERIMLIDTSVMPPIQAEYYKRRQMKILEKKM